MTDPTPHNPHELASAAGQSMYGRDRASRELGIRLDDIRPGYARMSMTVDAWMLQGQAVCHGGLMFALADSAMAFASNSHNEAHTALNCNIDFLRPAVAGDVLTAEATEDNRTRRTGMYNVRVTNQDGETVCFFRGRTYGIGGAVLREAES